MTTKTLNIANTGSRLGAFAGALIAAAGLFSASAAMAEERGGRWARDAGPRIERHYGGAEARRTHRFAHRGERFTRGAHRRAHRVHRRAHRAYRHWHRHGTGHGHWHYRGRYHGHRHGYPLAPIAVGIGVGALTYAIIDSHTD